MPSVKITDFIYSIRFRLIAWYSVVFILSCSLLFLFLDHKIQSHQKRELRHALENTLFELNEICRESGIKDAREHMRIEVETSQELSKAFAQYSASGQSLFLVQPKDTKLAFDKTMVDAALQGNKQFAIVDAQSAGKTYGLLYVPFLKNQALVIGQSMDREEHLHRKLIAIFWEATLVAVIPLAAIIGALLSGRALADIYRMNQVAKKVAEGDLSQRMPGPERRNEIARLSATFNDMLERLESTFKEQKQITGDIAHDLRSPLTRMRGELEVALAKQRNVEEYQQVLESSIEEVDRLLQMVNILLDIGAMEYSVLEDRRRGSICPLLRDLVDAFGLVAEEKNISLKLDCVNLPDITFSTPALKRAIGNVLDNAVKYTPPGGNIAIAAKSSETHVIVSVADTGPGIPERDYENVFKRFFRLEESRTEIGSGLGLALVHAVIHSHSGRIEISQATPHGAVFTIYLPR